MTFKKLLRIALSIGVSFAILAILLNIFTAGMPDQQRPSVIAALQNTSVAMVFGYLFVYLVTLFIRAYRYQILIRVSGEENVPNMRQMALVTGIRNMMVDMLPARLGELGYVGLLNRGYGVKLQNCVSSLTLSVALDFIALLVVVIVIVLKQFMGVGIQGWAIGGFISALILSLVALFGLFAIIPWFTRLVSEKTNWAEGDSLFAKAVKLLDDFNTSLQTARRSDKLMSLLGLSVVIRFLKYFSFYILFVGVALPNFPSLAALPVEQVVSALIGGEIGASLPIPTFMSFGAYEAGTALVFQLLGVANQAEAFITMLCVHIWSQLVEYILGAILLCVFILLRNKRNASSETVAAKPQSTIVKLATTGLAGLVLLGGSFFLAFQLWAASKLGALSAPNAGGIADNVEDWRELSKKHVSSLNGFVVFSSNRDGNHDIFKLNLADYQLSKLTEHPHTETYPRISPDGKRLVFARAHQTWVSQRNVVAWDIYVLDLNTMQEIKVGENGTAPHWLDNKEITYVKEATKMMKVNVDSGVSTVAYETGVNNNMPKGSKIYNAKLNPKTGQLVFTARQSAIGSNTGHWGTAIDINGAQKGVMNGCELTWDSKGNSLYQVDPAQDGLRIVRVDPKTLEPTIVVNLVDEFNHEYWPKESTDGGYLVFGASRGPKDHEHDTKDYEIFLWKLGSDPSKATRLTFHTGNDNWPDAYIE